MSGQMASVRRFYGVPAHRGGKVVFSGLGDPLRCTILSSDGTHLWLRAPNGRRVGPVHPTSQMDYGDGRDYGAETNARIAAFNRAVNAASDGERS